MFLFVCVCVLYLFSECQWDRARMLSHFTQWRIFAQHMVKVVYSLWVSYGASVIQCMKHTTYELNIYAKMRLFDFSIFVSICRFCHLVSLLLWPLSHTVNILYVFCNFYLGFCHLFGISHFKWKRLNLTMVI